jgi:hypothetical protein
MAREQDVSITTSIVKVKDRTWRLQCFTDLGTDYTFQALRERVYLDAQGNVVKREALPDVTRRVSQVMDDPAAMAMLAAVRDMADKWSEEDEALSGNN